MTVSKRNLKRNEKLVKEIKKFLEDNDILQDTRIYFNGVAYHAKYNREDSSYYWILLSDISPSTYFEYGNDETVAMSFEGPLNYILNYGEDRELHQEFNAIFKRHDCYYELGHAWNLSVYYNDEVGE